MIGTKSQSRVKPQGLGITTNSSTYGQTIPVVLGTTKGSLYLIWCQNVRQGPSGKKGKGSSKKGGMATYVANVDCLIGTNPIMGVLSCWNNNQARLGLFPIQANETAGEESYTIDDTSFYMLVAATVAQAYDVTINDYGANDESTLSGTANVPLWNIYQKRSARFDPYYQAGADGAVLLQYLWIPYSGATITFDASQLAGALIFYYAQIEQAGTPSVGSSIGSPLAQLQLTFEPTLGDGPEFQGNASNGQPYSNQQILYPHYAGVGSQQLDLGYTGLAPSVQVEIMGSLAVFPSTDTGFAAADADFADMVIDICGQGVVQAGAGEDTAYTQIQHALPCADWPGIVQRRYNARNAGGSCSLTFGMPNSGGNFLVACMVADSVSGASISDAGGSTWHSLLADGNRAVWYSEVVGSGSPPVLPAGNKVTMSGAGTNAVYAIFEIGGVDTFDLSSVSATAAGAAITTTNAGGTPEYMLALTLNADTTPSGPFAMTDPQHEFWPTLFLDCQYGRLLAQDRVGYQPFEYLLNNTATGAALDTKVVIIGFKCSEPPGYPKALGNILDFASLQECWNCCRANGLVGSLIMDSQKAARDWLKDIYTAMNAAPVWSGFKLKSIPYAENSYAGNGATYISPTASGPIAVLSEDDLVGDSKSPLITVRRKAQVDIPNLLQLQYPNRLSDYNTVITSQPMQGSIALYGQNKDSPQMLTCIQDATVAQAVLGAMIRRQTISERNTYEFTVKARWNLLEAMDLIEINDSEIGLTNFPVRLTSVEEDDKRQLKCEAEAYLYGTSALNPIPTAGSGTGSPPVQPPAPPTQPPNQSGPGLNGDPGTGNVPQLINQPVFIEVPPQISYGNAYGQLNIVVSGAVGDELYGGCNMWVSVDGENYTNYGPTSASGLTGYTANLWPAAQSPDETNDLTVDFTESMTTAQQPLMDLSTEIANAGTIPLYVEGGAGLSINFADGPFLTIGQASDPTGIKGPYASLNPENWFFVVVWGLNSETDWVESNFIVTITPGHYSSEFESGWTPTIHSRPAGDPPYTSGVGWTSEEVTEVQSIYIVGGRGPTNGVWWLPGITPSTPGHYTLLVAVDGVLKFRVPITIAGEAGPGTNGINGAQWLTGPTISGVSPFFAPCIGSANSQPSTAAFIESQGIPYELVGYFTVVQVAGAVYTFKATGTTGGPLPIPIINNYLNRSMFGCPNAPDSEGRIFGVAHPGGSRVAMAGNAYAGHFTFQLQPSMIGKTLYFKFQAFNTYRNAMQDLADCTVFTYTPGGFWGLNQQSLPTQGVLVNGG